MAIEWKPLCESEIRPKLGISDVPLNIDTQINRTIAIIKQLAQGKHLTLKDGHKIGMGADLSIGFVLTNSEGGTSISGLSTMDFKTLNTILNENEIFFVVQW